MMSTRSRDAVKREVDIGIYRRQEEIGKGSFATVYKASVSKKPGFVAIKSVDLHRLNKKLKENLYSEIHILKGLHHPHIVSLIDCKETSAHIHLIMEFCELGDLSYFIKKKDSPNLHETMKDMIRKYPSPQAGGLNEVIVRHLTKQLVNAVEFLRRKNFIHRDVKPQNLLLNPSPHYYTVHPQASRPYSAHEGSLAPNVGIESLPILKLADFGFARSLPSTSLAETLCGSPLYMAPEILRYEKYDARVDLWSIGTVLYEMMTGKPPFKASNHVELLRKIEKGDDRIAFPAELLVSDLLKKLVRGLLKRHPEQRMSFEDLFSHAVIKDPIPSLAEEDIALHLPRLAKSQTTSEVCEAVSSSNQTRAIGSRASSENCQSSSRVLPMGSEQRKTPTSISARSPRASSDGQSERRRSSGSEQGDPSASKRPPITSHMTAPARHDLHAVARRQNAGTRESEVTAPLSQDVLKRYAEPSSDIDGLQEQAAQDVAFERDYVVVEKRAVEVNAFADELAASPKISSGSRKILTRRATQQGPPYSHSSAHASPSRAMQIAGKRSDTTQIWRDQHEYRYRDQTSATSAISKAINLASGRLFGMGFSPPLGLGRAGPSPPSYSVFPRYNVSRGTPLLLEDESRKSAGPVDDDTWTVQIIEDRAIRSDVVFAFAEVKYKQLIPLAPSTEHVATGLGDRDPTSAVDGEADGLTLDATVTLSEEALVLYVKALSILARAMDVAGAWWASRESKEAIGDQASSISGTSSTNQARCATRINSAVQWIRTRFNETLEKAEFVGMKLQDAQKRLPKDHPSHPSQHSQALDPALTSTNQVIVTSGITAEKLMYDRALEMSRSAAVNELVGEDLSGCERAYITAIRMLEAVLEEDEEPATGSQDSTDRSINGIEAEDRQVVLKFVKSIKNRLQALRKKMHQLARRSGSHQSPATRAPSSTGSGTPPLNTHVPRASPPSPHQGMSYTPPR